MISLRKGMTAAVLITAGGMGLLTIPAGAATSALSDAVTSTSAVGVNHSHTVPNVNIIKSSGHYVFNLTSLTGYKVSKHAFNHCNLPKVSYTITNTTSVTQQVKFTPAHGGGDFGPALAPGGVGGGCSDVTGTDTNLFTLASNSSASLTVTIVKR